MSVYLGCLPASSEQTSDACSIGLRHLVCSKKGRVERGTLLSIMPSSRAGQVMS